jgi:hypothetical protein
MDTGYVFVFLAIPVVLLLSLFLVFKQVTAKTRKTYWISLGLFMLLGVAMLTMVNVSGIVPELPKRPAPDVGRIFSQVPVAQLVLLALAAAIWMIGVPFLIIRQTRKAGRSLWAYLNPLNPPFRDFDAEAWKIFGLLAVSSLTLGMAAVSLSPDASVVPNDPPPTDARAGP